MSEIVDSEIVPRIKVRDVEKADVPVLTSIKGEGTEALHLDRLRDAQSAGFRYLVLLADKEIVGFACLVIRRPQYWSDANDTRNLPQIVDLQIKESHRGQGYGSDFVRAMERMASNSGHTHLYISVELSDNPRAFDLYRRLGYEPLQWEPYQKSWEFQDSEGNLHYGEDWIVDMVKQLT